MPVPHSYPEAKERVKEYFGTADDPPSVSTLDWFKSRGSSNFGRSVGRFLLQGQRVVLTLVGRRVHQESVPVHSMVTSI